MNKRVFSTSHPIFLGIWHDPAPVRKAMNLFKRIIKGKRFLFLEITPSALNFIPEFEPKIPIDKRAAKYPERLKVTSMYAPLIVEALKAGLKVVPLDSEEMIRESNYKHNVLSLDQFAYRNRPLREKYWENILRNAGSNSVVVAASEHIEALQQRLKVPKSNCVLDKVSYGRKPRIVRALAEQERYRVEQSRLKRRLKRAQERSMRRKR